MKKAVEPSTRPASVPKPELPSETCYTGERYEPLQNCKCISKAPSAPDESHVVRHAHKGVMLTVLPRPVGREMSPHFAVAGGVPDQLDDIFGMTQRQQQPMAAPPAHDDLLGAFQDSSLSSPSERFETPRSSPHPAVSAQQPSDDLLGGFEGSLGESGQGLKL